MGMTDRNAPVRASSSESTYSLMEFMRDFPDDASCLEWLWRTRFAEDGEHAECPKCEQVRVFRRYKTMERRQSWTCTGCGHHLHPTSGTIFHKSSTSLHLWFYAMYLMTSTRCGISAKQLERELGVTYKTAWRIFTLIRKDLMEQDTDKIGGDREVEADEAVIGGQPRAGSKMTRKEHNDRKVSVFGAVERGGQVRVTTMRSRGDAFHHVKQVVVPESILFTDDYSGYAGLQNKYNHKRINHSKKIYVSGDVHTQTIEGFWALVKNGIKGTYHAVSAKHLQGYLNEYAWRYNHRKDGRAMFLTLILRSSQECQSV